MLRALNPPDDRAPCAYRVPWSVDRVFDTHPLVTNTSPTAADFVRVFTWSPDAGATTEHRGRVLPGETVELCLCEADPDEAIVTIAWFRQEDGLEYVWRFVL